jgi:hypothetical protein
VSRGQIAALLGAAALAAALRLPYLHAGIGMDEGGYAYIASRWAAGASLYHSVWVDRPQGLLLAYRALLDLGSSTWSIRLGALLAGTAVTVLVGVVATLVESSAAGIAAALVYAVVGVGPHIEGFTFNGELAAALPSTAAVVAALRWRRTGRWYHAALAGLLGGSAILMKQSGFDGLVVALGVALWTPTTWRSRLSAGGTVAAGAAVPLGASALDGWLTGWHAYWYAVVGYRLTNSGASRSVAARADSFMTTLGAARADLLTTAIVAGVGIAICLVLRPRRVVPVAWLLVALVAFNVGGRYWAHYYVQLVPPLAVLAGIAAARAPRRVAVGAVALAIAPVVLGLVRLEQLTPAAFAESVPYDARSQVDAQLARLIRAHTRPRDTIYAFDSEADLYFLADRHTTYPYLWGPPVGQIPGALRELRHVLEGPHPPRVVVVYTFPANVDRTGAIVHVLRRRYRPICRTSDALMLALRRPGDRQLAAAATSGAVRFSPRDRLVEGLFPHVPTCAGAAP